MEYYLIISKDCNLQCTYCYRAKGSIANAQLDHDLIKKVSDFILSDSTGNKRVTFHGGEPLLHQDIMKRLIATFEGRGIMNILYTNGTLLDRIDPWILQRVQCITVSIDGCKDIHDKYRGKGTYDNIIGNVKRIRSIYNGHIMGRITLSIDSESSLGRSVMSLIDMNIFDSVNWQIQNSPGPFSETLLAQFLERYKQELSGVVKQWLRVLDTGKVLNILPVQCAVRTWLLRESFETFRCGCGTRLVFVDLTEGGTCYACDELVDDGLFKIGSVHHGVVMPYNLKHCSINKECARCEIKSFCGGRCLRSCVVLPKNMFYFYCETVKTMHDSVSHYIADIEKCLSVKQYLRSDVLCSALDLVEGIP